MQGLEVVLRTAAVLHGERHSPELPLPRSAIEQQAERYGFSEAFVGLVQAYDAALLEGGRRKMRKATGGKNSNSTSVTTA